MNVEEVLGEFFNYGYLVMFVVVYIFFFLICFDMLCYVREECILISDIMIVIVCYILLICIFVI